MSTSFQHTYVFANHLNGRRVEHFKQRFSQDCELFVRDHVFGMRRHGHDVLRIDVELDDRHRQVFVHVQQRVRGRVRVFAKHVAALHLVQG